MAEFRRMFLLLLLQFTAAATGQNFLYVAVRAGDDVTLPCKNVIRDQQNCSYTSWLFGTSPRISVVELVKNGRIGQKGQSKSDRLSVTEKCSLVIQKVTAEDGGRYDCRQVKPGTTQAPDAAVVLSVVSLTEHVENNEAMFSCSVSTYESCQPTVNWKYGAIKVKKDHPSIRTSQSASSSSATVQTSIAIYESRYNFLSCEVTVCDGTVFNFRLQPPDKETTTTTITTTTTTMTTTTNLPPRTTGKVEDLWWLFLIVAVVVVGLLIVVVVKIIRWKKTKGNKTGMNNNTDLSSNPAWTQEVTADPVDGISYASISYTKKNNSEDRVKRQSDQDIDETVTYVTVKPSSADPSDLYATVK